MLLSDIAVKNAKPKDKAYKMTDGRGMFLLVAPTGGKSWRYKYRFGGKEKTLSVYLAVRDMISWCTGGAVALKN